jgi:hypothetical protein
MNNAVRDITMTPNSLFSGFEPTPLIHYITIRLALRPAP